MLQPGRGTAYTRHPRTPFKHPVLIPLNVPPRPAARGPGDPDDPTNSCDGAYVHDVTTLDLLPVLAWPEGQPCDAGFDSTVGRGCDDSMAVLPTGTVTLLFTDLEGSTELLKRLGSGYAGVLEDHRRLLEGAIADHGGMVVDTQGDSCFAAFSRGRDAVAAAIEGQRSLATHSWPAGESVCVRMGLHTGEPAVDGGRYVGLTVHRAARIMALGHGGQVLLSRSTAAVVEDGEVAGVTLRDLGEHRLKDIDRPERVFQLVAEGLRPEFPPLRTGAVQRRRRRATLVLVAAAAAVLTAAVGAAVILTLNDGQKAVK